jgi:outer membrane protein TolC
MIKQLTNQLTQRARRVALVASFFAPTAALLGVPGHTLAAQSPTTLRLRDVVQRVAEQGFTARASTDDARAADANARAARAHLLPQLRLEAGAARTNDPIGVFGAKLRQRSVTQADFDPRTLNRPDALSMGSGAVVMDLPVFAPQAILGQRAASLAARAAHAMTDHTINGATLAATRSYFGAVLATASVSALDSAVAAATAHVAQATSLERNGVVARSDLLLAQVRLSELEARRSSARGAASLARLALAVQMGEPGDTARSLPTTLPSAAMIRALVTESDALAPTTSARDDVKAARLGAQAAREDLRRAKARWLPSVGAMLRSDWAAPNQPFAGTPFVTAGVVVTLPVFSGGGEYADRQRASATFSAAQTRADGAAAMAELEVSQASIQRRVAMEQLTISERAYAQAVEALRLVQRRYDGGLAAITELLDAGAARSTAELAAVTAQHNVLIALAEERIARGLDLNPLLSLER